MNFNLKFIYIILVTFFVINVANAQSEANTQGGVRYGATLDTTSMQIGDQQHYSLVVQSANKNLNPIFPLLKDSIVSGVEILSGPQRDSLKLKNGDWLFHETYIITAFDKGVYMFPSQAIVIQNKGFDNTLYTDSISLMVSTVKVDMKKGSYDIVSPIDTPWKFSELLPYVKWILLGVIVVLVLIYMYFHYVRKSKKLEEKQKVVIPPYTAARSILKEIGDNKLWKPGNEKLFYTKLTDAVRLYLSGEVNIAAIENTSAEILSQAKKSKDIEKEDFQKLTRLLETADFVKFAKYFPLEEENVHFFKDGSSLIEDIHAKLEERRKALELAQKEKADKASKDKASKDKASKDKASKDKAAKDKNAKDANKASKVGKK